MLPYYLRVVLQVLSTVEICFTFAVPYNWCKNLVENSVTNQSKDDVIFSANQM